MGSIKIDDRPVDIGADLRNWFGIKLACGLLFCFGELLWLGTQPIRE